ncbi:hypothetical protein M2336_001788 [Sphingobium sp. B1D7B]|uniref:PEPxxWA-CTERM sorting domain-containing protein n=1 Tax=unclassified Sphingobium TaxID=2611147 RepID=UPI0022258197|nr:MULTISPECIES: PEPxxWA-CTERM sorting domain-containing protein [unclassified Sphingobium]MCW2393276.1 hypothetical protein [Sphingobium sp. B11D3A]MCW2405159.1 hypothetical protein [Sphingobium sp. B1D7B]MCW2411393.1 hypothetical protein [Sphingobium sp. B8D3D]MCW2416314.1 hypothetical protein [Sphingobium sp. B8D3A]
MFHKSFRKAVLLSAATIAATAMLPASASASTFVLSGGNNSDGSIGNVRTYTGSDGTKLEVTAYSLNGTTLAAGAVGAYSPGLGVMNSFPNWWGQGGDDSHTVDNNGYVDILVFQFDKIVTIDKIGLVSFGDTDINYAVGSTNVAFNSTFTIANYSTFNSLFGPTILSNGNGQDQNRDINPNNLSGNLFYVAAAFSNSGSNDSFKVNGLTYAVTQTSAPVPEPATWGMMICGLAVTGYAMRRRKTNATISFA